MTDDPREREHISDALRLRRQPMPSWLTGMSTAVIDPEVWKLSHILGDGDDYFVSLDLGDDAPLTALIYVDHNMGTVVKDAFIAPVTMDEFLQRIREMEQPGQTLAPIDAAQARAVTEDAITTGAMMLPPFESDTWPMCRPVIEWMLRKLPDGGVAMAHREWEPEELQEISADFTDSPYADELDLDLDLDVLDSILWFASGYTDGDPYRWSPVNVEMLLVDWYPRKIMDIPLRMERMPDVLRAYVRYCHAHRGIPEQLTRETLDAVDHWEPAYLASIAAGTYPSFEDDEPSIRDYLLDRLSGLVGGAEALESLDTVAIPDEPFEWSGIADDIQGAVSNYLAEIDRVAEGILNIEYRTAMRRLLHLVALGDSAIFRRKASPARGAAAIAWLILRANEYRGSSVQDLLAAFGVTGSVSQRAEPMLRAIGIDPYRRYGDTHLGNPELLISQTRASIIRQRELAREIAEDAD